MNHLKIFYYLFVIVSLGGICVCCISGNKNETKAKSDTISSSLNSNLDYNQIGNQLLQNETIGDLKIGLSIDKTLELLGESNEKTKLELWGADGEYHHTMIYHDKGIEIDIVGENGTKQKIGMISITEPCLFKTKENIGIGSGIYAVKTAYKGLINPEFSDSNSIVVGSIYGGLILKMENDKVKKIIVGAVAE